MSLVKEPDGVDFIIQSPPLTNKEREEISAFINAHKLIKKCIGSRKIQKKKTKVSQ